VPRTSLQKRVGMRLCFAGEPDCKLQYGPEKPRDLASKGITYQTAVNGDEALTEPTHKRDVPFPAQMSGVIRPTSVRWLCTAHVVSLMVHHHPRPCCPQLTKPAARQVQFHRTKKSQPCDVLCSLTILANRFTRSALLWLFTPRAALGGNKKRQHVTPFRRRCSFLSSP
jgi:hypothetical protein